MKLRLEERVPLKVAYSRRAKTEAARFYEESNPEEFSKMFSTTSFSYYSHNYDRSYSTGMNNLSKMRYYDNLKKMSTLKRG